MSNLQLCTDQQINGCQLLVIENEHLRIGILPELGGRVYQLVHKSTERDYLWKHPHNPPSATPIGSSYDDHFCGGWDEQFPSDDPCEYKGRTYPDHGEYWNRGFQWEADVQDAAITLHLWAKGCMTPTQMHRWITVASRSSMVHTRHQIRHMGGDPFSYLWKLHPALTLGKNDELIIPAGRGATAEGCGGRLSSQAEEFDWPMVPGRDGKQVDLRSIPCSAEEDPRECGVAVEPPGYEMVYLTELHAGFWAVLDRENRSGIGMAFDRTVFNRLWLFQSFGGWDGLHLVVPEPSTSYPSALSEAAATGTVKRLQPGQFVQTETAFVCFTERDQIKNISLDGHVQ
jgi:hypothetical protein